MNKLQMNLLSLLAQVGFAKVSKEQVREEIEKNFTGKKEVLASLDTLFSIEEKYVVLIEQVKADRETAKEQYSSLLQDIEELDVTEAKAVNKMMELETQRVMAESKVRASEAVIQSLEEKKKAELIAELPNTFQLGHKAKNQSFLLLGQIEKIVNIFNIKLLTQVLSEIDAEMSNVDYHMHRVARETGVSGTLVNGVHIEKERDYYTVMAIKLERLLNIRS